MIALFPELVSGRLAVPEEEWIELFGGPKPTAALITETDSEESGSKAETGSVFGGAVVGVESAGKKMLGALGIGSLKTNPSVAATVSGNSETQSLAGSISSEPKMTLEEKRREKETAGPFFFCF